MGHADFIKAIDYAQTQLRGWAPYAHGVVKDVMLEVVDRLDAALQGRDLTEHLGRRVKENP